MPSNTAKNQSKKRPKIPRSIIRDRVDPGDFLNINTIFCCEQCSYFEPKKKRCNLDLVCENHLKEQQLKTYNMSGTMAFCRFLEID